ncbi:SDR family oxidoreductase [Streptomyces huasconensis]|uniref:SDR family oxidoreductase n=1 Tax=Streptomyces huasconensis TaxID=1854574 RepID=UPI0033E563AC
MLITGCSSGLGRATALHLAASERRVIATVRSPLAQHALRDEARAADLDLHVIRMDICDAASVVRGLDEIGRLTGGIDALVNNAGVEVTGPMEHTTEENLFWQLETNVVGTYRLTRAILPAMRQARSGHLVFVSSIVGRAARPFLSAYCASKYAVEGLAESLYWEMRPFGVSVSLVEPGRYPSQLTRNGRNIRHAPEDCPYSQLHAEYHAGLATWEPKGYQPDPHEVALAIEQILDTADPPLRRPVGADALATLEAQYGRTFEEYEDDVIRQLGLSSWRSQP